MWTNETANDNKDSVWILFWGVKHQKQQKHNDNSGCVTCSVDATDEASEEVWPEGSSRLRSKLKKTKEKTQGQFYYDFCLAANKNWQMGGY